VAVVGVREAAHLGRIGAFADRVANEGFLFVALVSIPGNMPVAPPGTAQRQFGTNPVAFGVPTFDALPYPVVLDMATRAGRALTGAATYALQQPVRQESPASVPRGPRNVRRPRVPA